MGTGCFGCRDNIGGLDGINFAEKANLPEVKMSLIKLPKRAKSGHDGVLPVAKNTFQIAKIRGLLLNITILSSPSPSTFEDIIALIALIAKLRQLSNGKPIGFKLCIEDTREFELVCHEMITQNCFPDFITVDGAEAGIITGSLKFADGAGMPFESLHIFVNKALVSFRIKEKIRIISIGKLIFGYSIRRARAIGADICNSARRCILLLGCI